MILQTPLSSGSGWKVRYWNCTYKYIFIELSTEKLVIGFSLWSVCYPRWTYGLEKLNYRLKHFSKYFYWPFQGGAPFVDRLCYFCLVLICFHARLFVDALWSPAGKGLASWLSFVMSNCNVVTFPLVSWVRCGVWLYLFLIFSLFLTYVLWFILSSKNLPGPSADLFKKGCRQLQAKVCARITG